MDDDFELAEALGRAREGSQRRIRELLQSSPRRAHALLRASIRRGLITEKDLVEEHDLVMSMMMSRNSIRSALQQLGSEGLIRRRQRIGTNVVGSIWELPLLSLLPTGGWAMGADSVQHPGGLEMVCEVTDVSEVIAHRHIRERLELDGDRVVMAEQLVSIEGVPAGIIVGYHPIADATGPRSDREALDEAVRVFIDTVRSSPGNQVEATVEAVNADERTARILGLKEGAAILTRETLVRDAAGVPQFLAYGHYRGDRVALWAEDPEVAAMRFTAAPAPAN
ncbi:MULTISPECIES: GntR family transcriptional regulator [unclassified Rathayibacter]|uniref:GntR family transcriptional regulator n=1 Tax=unclassified Rathayibacter TaxID=2609250 RepID=UPI000F4BA29F|nr:MULTISPECIES: GntR family transcriptional regulator [unclassified Rathayibacter]MCJ1689394.1 GntR family transcriptional regulator [Rathayibacter sp. VKM Ac-2927]ROP56905.1 GntR family transcriptional regulator [Rathayibacter sp. PhB186]ROS28373.1 GntR family transcriptional regulator [Rathayibacter sp. PhB127]ROS55290.1 GntR family transcriptional regulator [Rathayibacter sp. PhB185]